MENYIQEYHKIYPHLEHGIELLCGNRKVVCAYHIACSEVFEINPEKSSFNGTSPCFVRCRKCDELMDYYEGSNALFSGTWICRTCKAAVGEKMAHNRYELIEPPDERYTELYPDDDRHDVCDGCAGEWPDCRYNCMLYNQ